MLLKEKKTRLRLDFVFFLFKMRKPPTNYKHNHHTHTHTHHINEMNRIELNPKWMVFVSVCVQACARDLCTF